MDLFGTDGLHLALRWFHVAAVITWVGHAFFFNWLDRSLAPVDNQREGEHIEGELWMVHSGGFYRVEKIHVAPERMPAALHWFKWEAAASGLSGLGLLAVVYYMGGGALLAAPGGEVDVNTSTLVGFGVLAAGWTLYDVLWATPFGRSKAAPWVGFAVIVALAWKLPSVMSARAAYVHVGALLGLIMVANVWRRIIPAQEALVAASRAGTSPDPELGKAAKVRSIHNNYLTLPVLFIMISNHFWGTYGHEHAWAILGLLVLVGAGLRHLMNQRMSGLAPSPAVAGLVVAAVLGAGWVARPAADDLADEDVFVASPADDDVTDAGTASGGGASGAPVPDGAGADATEAAGTGTIRGVVRLDGEVPAARELRLLSECQGLHAGAVTMNDVRATDGLLADAFVWIRSGVDELPVPRAPDEEVVIDQVGCLYEPRVVGLRVGQVLTLVNSDPLLHNVHAMPKRNREFNKGMPGGGDPVRARFKRSEVMVPLKCDIHPWMGAWIGVVDHPWFAVTGDDGAFVLDGLPDGTYGLEVWHATLGRLEQQVTVEAGVANVTFRFE